MLRTAISTLVATAIAATLGAQAPCFTLPLGTNLALTDDSTAIGLPLGFTFTYGGIAYTDISVCSNGYIWFGTGPAGGDFSPTEGELLTGGPRICPLWSDFNPAAAGSGGVYFDNSVPGIATVSWAGVYPFGTTTPVSFQVTLDASNSISVAYGAPAIPGTLNTTIIIGGSTGGGATANPVSLATRPIVSTSDTFYEVIPAVNGVPIAYGNFKMQWTPTAPGYIVADVTCTPNGLPVPASSNVVGSGCPGSAPVPLNAGDDTTHTLTLPFPVTTPAGTFTSAIASSNGFLVLGTTNPGAGCCAGDPVALRSGPMRIAPFWTDLNLNDAGLGGNGEIITFIDPLSGDYVVSWVNAGEYNTSPVAALNFQVAISVSGGITIRTQNVGLINATRVALTGFSVGGGAADPGVTDLSANGGVNATTMYQTFSNAGTPADMSGLEILLIPAGPDYLVLTAPIANYAVPASPLALAAGPGSAPQVGGSFTVDGSGIQGLPNGVFAILLISTEVPGGIPLDVLGLTGCTAYVALPEIASFFNITLGAPTTSWTIPIPNDNAFYGVSLMSQAVSDDTTANAFGYRVSNGLRWNFGL